MKPFLTILLFLIFFLKTFAQPSPCDSTIKNCAIKASKLNLAIDSVVVKYGKASAPNYFDVQYTLNCGGGATDYCRTNKDSALQIMVYYPKNKRSCKFHVYFHMHGGAYSDCGPVLSEPPSAYICRDIARMGFVACDVDYRRGVLIDTNTVAGSQPPVPYTTAQQAVAIYTGTQDVEGAIRYIIFSARSQTSSSAFEMDTTQLYIGGFSAGSVLALLATYYQKQSMLDAIFPNIKTVLGNIKVDYYKGDTSINYFPYIRAVNACWGNLLIPYSYIGNPASFFATNTNNPPIIVWHGKNDIVFNYQHQDYYLDPHTSFLGLYNPNSDTTCLNGGVYTLHPNSFHPDFRGLGSSDIYDVFTTHHIPAQFHLDCQSGHGFDKDCDTCTFQSDWGTGYHHVDSVIQYIAEQAVAWFQVNYADSVQYLTTTRFIECENYRIGCSTADSNNMCYNSDTCINSFDGLNGRNSSSNSIDNYKNVQNENNFSDAVLLNDKRHTRRTRSRKP